MHYIYDVSSAFPNTTGFSRSAPGLFFFRGKKIGPVGNRIQTIFLGITALEP